MKQSRNKILFVGNDESGGNSFKRFTEQENIQNDYVLAASVTEVAKDLLCGKFGVVIIDYSPENTMNDLLNLAEDVPVIVVTGGSDAGVVV